MDDGSISDLNVRDLSVIRNGKYKASITRLSYISSRPQVPFSPNWVS